MQVVVGQRYRYVRADGWTVDGVVAEGANGAFLFMPDGYRASFWTSRDGRCAGSRLHEIREPVLRPIFGDEPGSFDDLRRTFAAWDFSTGTY